MDKINVEMDTSNIQKNIDHVVVLMLENRAFDNLVGWLYTNDSPPNIVLPPNSGGRYNGLDGTNYGNPLDLNQPQNMTPATEGVENGRVPNPDPHENFKYMNRQQFGLNIDTSTDGWLPPEGQTPEMIGFLADYASVKDNPNPEQIMGTYTSTDMNVMSGIARAYAISDNYHASSPTQTWPNRSFMHAGTSLGHVNNSPYIPYDVTTIFNVLEDASIDWKVYSASEIAPSLTRIQMVKLWDPFLEGHFKYIGDFIDDCRSGDLPPYSFLEPSFVTFEGDKATSEHPPAIVCAGENYLKMIWDAMVSSPAFDRTLFIINFDEHGGCPDHVPPNWTAVSPGADSMPGDEGFNFNRYGVRVPCIFASPFIQEGTVFRANADPFSTTSVPYDHTSIIAMILDWQGIPRTTMDSARINAAPPNPFDELLSGTARSDQPTFSVECSMGNNVNMDDEQLTSLQKSIVAADAYYRLFKASGLDYFEPASYRDEVGDLLASVRTQKDMADHFYSIYEGKK